ncbi:MAG: tol-pal system protein YbgF, partial [Alphaproteobacteria bacterium]
FVVWFVLIVRSWFRRGLVVRAKLVALIPSVSLFLLAQSAWPHSDTSEDIPYVQRALQRALETARSETETTWKNPSTEHHGVVIPHPAFEHADGRPCRKYERTIVFHGSVSTYEGTGCREPNGVWVSMNEIQVTLAPSTSLPRPIVSDTTLTAEAQRLLADLGYEPGPADGETRPDTRAAIEAFQRDKGLVVDGIVTSTLVAHLQAAVAVSDAAGVAASAETPEVPSTELIFSPTPSSMWPVVLALDGFDGAAAIYSDLLPRGFDMEGRVVGELESAIEKPWGLEGEVVSVPWSGDLDVTADAISDAKGFIQLLAEKARRENRPFVIIGHSWGSVLAYGALNELHHEGALGHGSVDQLITIGSPLNTESLKSAVREAAHIDDIRAIGPGIREWRNYYIACDVFSQHEISAEDVIDRELAYFGSNPLECHRAYYRDDGLRKAIGSDIKSGLEARRKILESQERFLASEDAAESIAPTEARPTVEPEVADVDVAEAAPLPHDTCLEYGREVMRTSPEDVRGPYFHAFDLLAKPDYELAEKAFRAFIKACPEDPRVSDAWYWLGETYYFRNDYESAARTFARGYEGYPDGGKAPNSVLKLGLSLAALDRTEDACITLGELSKRYPDAADNILRRGQRESERLGCAGTAPVPTEY